MCALVQDFPRSKPQEFLFFSDGKSKETSLTIVNDFKNIEKERHHSRKSKNFPKQKKGKSHLLTDYETTTPSSGCSTLLSANLVIVTNMLLAFLAWLDIL